MARNNETTVSGQLRPRTGARPPAGKVVVAVPAYGGACSMIFAASLFRLTASAPSLNVKFKLIHYDYSDIVVSRNLLASSFYYLHPEASHMLFLDSDMGFGVDLIRDMLLLDKDLVGTIYPKRSVDLRALYASEASSFEAALAEAAGFVGESRIKVKQGFVNVDRIGTGIMLISRRCLDRMVAACPDIVDETRFRRWPIPSFGLERVITPFDKIRTDDTELSEDFSFCHRWTQGCGGKIYAAVSHKVQHEGRLVVDAAYSDLA